MKAQELDDFREYDLTVIEEVLAKRKLSREPKWAEGLAVGSQPFTDRMKTNIHGRMKLVQEVTKYGKTWIIKEP